MKIESKELDNSEINALGKKILYTLNGEDLESSVYAMAVVISYLLKDCCVNDEDLEPRLKTMAKIINHLRVEMLDLEQALNKKVMD